MQYHTVVLNIKPLFLGIHQIDIASWWLQQLKKRFPNITAVFLHHSHQTPFIFLSRVKRNIMQHRFPTYWHYTKHEVAVWMFHRLLSTEVNRLRLSVKYELGGLFRTLIGSPAFSPWGQSTCPKCKGTVRISASIKHGLAATHSIAGSQLVFTHCKLGTLKFNGLHHCCLLTVWWWEGGEINVFAKLRNIKRIQQAVGWLVPM